MHRPANDIAEKTINNDNARSRGELDVEIFIKTKFTAKIE